MKNPSETFDIIVIGSGFAGLAAAIEASEAGASVVVLEKMRAVGGNSVISDGGIAAAGTVLQEKHGFSDSPDLMYEDMMNAGMGLNQSDLVRLVADRSNEVFKWTKEHLGVKYMDRVDHFGGHSVHRCYTTVGRTGAAIIKKQVEKLKELEVEIRLGTVFTSFVLDNDGRVKGVRAREGYRYNDPSDGTESEIPAGKAVILATGGFGADVGFRVKHDPRLTAEVDTTNTPHATAEALREAIKLGAAPVDLSHIQLGPWTSPDEKGFGDGPVFADYIAFLYGLAVDPDTGRRFVNELGDRKIVSDAILKVGHPCIGIADDAAVKDQGWDISRALEKGVVKKFESFQDLAIEYGIPVKELETTIERFNRCIVNRKDEEFGKPILPDAAPVTVPPFFAVRLWPKVHFTMGGVRIDTRARVIDVNGDPIPGLYAAGEVTGGVHGACRLGSCAITECLVFGRIAGKEAAENKVH